MKARVKATGEIVDVKYTIKHISNGELYKCIAVNGKEYMADQVELIPDEPDYWEKLKHQSAVSAMQGMVRLVGHDRMYPPKKMAIFAVECATALVEKLKEDSKC